MRTADDAMLTVKLMIFYELTDVIKLVSLSSSSDTIMKLLSCSSIIIIKLVSLYIL